MKTLSRKSGAFLLVAALLLTLFALPTRAYAMDVDETGCTIQFDLGTGDTYADLKALDSFPATLYKIANVDENYDYTATGDFASLQDKLKGFKYAEPDEVDDVVEAAAEVAATLTTDSNVTFTKGEATVELGSFVESGDKETGMYLLCVDNVRAGSNEYVFSPVLIPVPVLNENGDGSDDYSVAVSLKPEASPLTSLRIVKDLRGYSELHGQTSFIFEVEATVDKETVYKNVVSIDFNKAESRELVIENLPVGAQVTVTEVYSGTTYEAVAGTDTTQTIEALVGAPNFEADENTVIFSNDYTPKNQNGTSVVNVFKNEHGSWQWIDPNEQQPTPAN